MTTPDFTAALTDQLPGLRRYAIALAGNSVLADDLVQDTIERALRQAAQLRETDRIAGWLRRILYNLYIDETRRRKSRGKEEDITELGNRLELSTSAIDRTATSEFVRALNRLSAEHREILLLVGLQELSYREIAEELGIPVGTVMSRLARARERLRRMLENDATAEVVPLHKNVGGSRD